MCWIIDGLDLFQKYLQHFKSDCQYIDNVPRHGFDKPFSVSDCWCECVRWVKTSQKNHSKNGTLGFWLATDVWLELETGEKLAAWLELRINQKLINQTTYQWREIGDANTTTEWHNVYACKHIDGKCRNFNVPLISEVGLGYSANSSTRPIHPSRENVRECDGTRMAGIYLVVAIYANCLAAIKI